MIDPTPRPACFFDRDGVLNVNTGYVHSPAGFQWVDGARDAIRRLNGAGYRVFVVTNQSGVARGYYAEDDVRALHVWMNAELERVGARIDDFRYCPHHPEHGQGDYRRDCDWRKPGPGMILDLMRHWPVTREGSFMVGDSPSDGAAAAAAGLPFHLFAGGNLDTLIAAVLAAR
jgi:D-glycero-D-manno-heptose 1,7-bisphosphate phosphatase